MKNPVRMGLKLCEKKGLIKKICGIEKVAHNPDAINMICELAEIDKAFGAYSYSFATKICNRLNNMIPIFDRFIAGIIYKTENDDNHITLKSLGDYEFFVNEYDRIKNNYEIECSYKEIDIYLWTYAKIHKLAWNDELGVDVEYRPKII